MTAPPSRQRRRSGGSQTFARLTAARERLDAAVAERRRREDELLAEYAAAADAAAAVATRRDAALADLDRQATQLRAGAEQDMAGFEARQGAILVLLNADRSAEELAQLVGLGLKRVRHLLRTYREPPAPGDRGDASQAAPAAPAPPPARPVGEGMHPDPAVGNAAAAVERDASPADPAADVAAPPAVEQRPGDGAPLEQQG